jgi:2-haloacid dehalogenase
VQQKYPFFDWFDEVILSGAVKLNKPDPAIFKLILNKSGFSASQCVLIDDSQSNIDTANQIGFFTIHFISPDQLQTDLQTLDLL